MWSKKKLSFDEVKERFNDANMEVLNVEYINSYTPLKVRCGNGHEFGYTIEKLKTAKCCIYCRREGMI